MALAARAASCSELGSFISTKAERKAPVARTLVSRVQRKCSSATRYRVEHKRLVVAASRGGTLDSPTLSPTQDKSTLGDRKKPPMYKVMLHNDNYNRREYVVKVLLQVVEGLTVDDAVVVMQEAHETGVALVVACAQDVAESYVESLRLNGLVSTLEPGH